MRTESLKKYSVVAVPVVFTAALLAALGLPRSDIAINSEQTLLHASSGSKGCIASGKKGRWGESSCCLGVPVEFNRKWFRCSSGESVDFVDNYDLVRLEGKFSSKPDGRAASISVLAQLPDEELSYFIIRRVQRQATQTRSFRRQKRSSNRAAIESARWALIGAVVAKKGNGRANSFVGPLVTLTKTGSGFQITDRNLLFAKAKALPADYLYQVLAAKDDVLLTASRVLGIASSLIPKVVIPTATPTPKQDTSLRLRCENYSCIMSDNTGLMPCESSEDCWAEEAGLCCIGVYDPRCGSRDDPNLEMNARDWIKDVKDCARKVVFSWDEFVNLPGVEFVGSCTRTRMLLFAHGPRPENLIRAAKVCVEKFGCSGSAYSYACQNFADITAATQYLVSLQKSIPAGVEITITGNQSNGITFGGCPDDNSNSRVTYKVTQKDVTCQLRQCPREFVICTPVGAVIRCLGPDKKESFQICCPDGDKFGAWAAPGEECKSVYKCTGENPAATDTDHLLVACSDQDISTLKQDTPYSIVETCDAPCQYKCSSIAVYQSGQCVPKDCHGVDCDFYSTPTPTSQFSAPSN